MATLKYKNPATSAWETLDALPAIGQTVEITVTELAGKSTADRAAMYAAGTRLLKVVNGDTEVLLGLQSDGSTAWLGSNKPLNNLLDNSNFANPVNQRGATTYTTNNAYTIDRWILEGSTCWVTDTMVSVASSSYLVQRIPENKMSSTKAYTLATMDNAGNIKVGNAAGMVIFDNDGTYGFNTIKINAGEYLWAALYEGSYTADTMPPYVPKGYAAELAECQRYFVSVSYNNTMLCGNTGNASGVGARLYLPLSTRMRINPTVSAFTVNASYYGGAKSDLVFTPSNAEATYTGLCLYGNLSGAVSASPTYVDAVYQIRNADLAISADL